MEYISRALFGIANSLLIPDIILLILFFLRALCCLAALTMASCCAAETISASTIS